jgi:hypothetical protein
MFKFIGGLVNTTMQALQGDVHHSQRKCDGKRFEVKIGGIWWGTCLRCDCMSGYAESRSRCPVLRTQLWRPRPTSDGRWNM